MLRDMLIRHEGIVLTAYEDSLGIPTVGVGHNLSKPISHHAAMVILEDDIADAISDLEKYSWFRGQSDIRRTVLIDMMFNLGATRFKGFKKMIAAIKEGDYVEASIEMLDSKWAYQVGSRATELSDMMRHS